ncbi:MAG: cysteine desulfurase family protein [Polyangiaceae bacterium]
MQELPVYLDHNATTPISSSVLEAMLPYLREAFGNPSSGHVYGARARAAVDTARQRVAALLGCDADELVFTSGGTEANNLAIRGVMERAGARRRLVTSVVEHPATERPCAWLERRGFSVERVPVDAGGRLDLELTARAIDASTALVSVMHSNNETGVLQPVAEVATLARAQRSLVHVDAAQSIGKVAVRVRELGVDLLSIAGHKLYAPKGVGALYVRRGVQLEPLVLGASHERGLRPGTENVASIVGLGAACELALADLESEAERVRGLRDALFERLAREIPNLAVNGVASPRLPNTLSVRFPRVSGAAVLAGAPEVAASTGSACHEGHESASAVILAMGVPAADALGTVRLTLGRATTEPDVERAAAALIRAYRAAPSIRA